MSPTRIEKAARMIGKASKPRRKKKKKAKPKKFDLLSSGSTLLNLACTDNPFGAFMKGKYYYLVGDSASGKTFLCMTCFAEALLHPRFKDYRFIYDNVEDGMLLNLRKLFNAEVEKRVEAPASDENGASVYSATIEDFYYNIDDAVKVGKPFLYVLDSMDGLSSEAAEEKFYEKKEAHRKGKEVAGSYGDGKAKKNSEYLRKIQKGLRHTGSILIVVSQTRDNLGMGFEKKTRSGGHALKFYATCEVWTSLKGTIKKNVQKKDRSIGVRVGLKVRKNRTTGWISNVETLIYPSYGIDDIGSCVDYLVSEGWWEKKKTRIKAKEFDIIMTREKLILHIEQNDLAHKLRKVTGRCWREIKKACALDRPGRYSK